MLHHRGKNSGDRLLEVQILRFLLESVHLVELKEHSVGASYEDIHEACVAVLRNSPLVSSGGPDRAEVPPLIGAQAAAPQAGQSVTQTTAMSAK